MNAREAKRYVLRVTAKQLEEQARDADWVTEHPETMEPLGLADIERVQAASLALADELYDRADRTRATGQRSQ